MRKNSTHHFSLQFSQNFEEVDPFSVPSILKISLSEVFDILLLIFNMLTCLCLIMFNLCKSRLLLNFFSQFPLSYQIQINTESGQFILLYRFHTATPFFFCKFSSWFQTFLILIAFLSFKNLVFLSYLEKPFEIFRFLFELKAWHQDMSYLMDAYALKKTDLYNYEKYHQYNFIFFLNYQDLVHIDFWNAL